jgi:hypothetical protein
MAVHHEIKWCGAPFHGSNKINGEIPKSWMHPPTEQSYPINPIFGHAGQSGDAIVHPMYGKARQIVSRQSMTLTAI